MAPAKAVLWLAQTQWHNWPCACLYAGEIVKDYQSINHLFVFSCKLYILRPQFQQNKCPYTHNKYKYQYRITQYIIVIQHNTCIRYLTSRFILRYNFWWTLTPTFTICTSFKSLMKENIFLSLYCKGIRCRCWVVLLLGQYSNIDS